MKFTRLPLVVIVALLAMFTLRTACAQNNPPADSVFNVKNFGAKADGRSDDTAAIQTALDEAADYHRKTRNIGTVLLPSGNYRIAPPRLANGTRAYSIFVVASGVTVQGGGGAQANGQTWVTATQPTRLLVGDNAGDYNSVFSSDQTRGDQETLSGRTRVEQVRFRDFWIDQDPQRNRSATIADRSDNGYQFAILLKNFNDVTVERMKFAPATGKNIVHLAGQNCSKPSVLNSYFQFVNGNANNRDYDNSALYLEAKNQIVRGNVFSADLKEGARGAIEAHSGPALVENNQSEGFLTGINITSTSPVNNENNEDANPSGYDNAITVRNNRFLRAGNAIQLWSFSRAAGNGRGPARRRLANVRIEGNLIEMAPKLQIAARQAAGRSAGSMFAIGFVRGADNVNSPSQRDGDFESIFITNNTIIYPAETDAPIASPTTSPAIRVDPRSRLRNIRIEGNRIERAPFGAIVIGGGDLPGAGFTQSAIYVARNQIIDAGYSQLFPDRPAYRTPIRVYGQLQDVRFEGNRIIDRANPPRAQYVFRNDADGQQGDNFLATNQIELGGGYVARQVAKGVMVSGGRGGGF